ncbi:MAG: hypothetical protein AABP62_08440 [Planctomycetota bacterium]
MPSKFLIPSVVAGLLLLGLFFAVEPSICLAQLSANKSTPIFAAPLANHKISGYAWSHDGKSIAITSHSTAPYVEWVNGPITD